MSETLVEVAGETGGWLAEHQRQRRLGHSALDTYQGVLFDEIVLPQSAVDAKDPLQLVLACGALNDSLQDQALLIAGEYAPEVLFSHFAHDYLVQASTGGHAQYFANRRQDELAIKCCGAALKSMLADPHLEIFNLMLRLKRNPPAVARKIASQNGYRSIKAAMHDLDRRFAALEEKEPLTTRHKMWLKSLRKLRIAPDAEMNEHLTRIAQANPLWHRRKAEADAIRAEHERTDPTFRAARALCDQAGLRFAGMRDGAFAPMRAIWPEGPDVTAYACRVETDRGARAALFYGEGGLFKRRLAVLLEQGGTLPLGSLNLSASEFSAIVPDRPKSA
jgi:hypothetical protein